MRLARAGLILTREGVFADIDPALLPPQAQTFRPFLLLLAKKRQGPRETNLARAIEKLGPSYVKLGQFLATRPGPARNRRSTVCMRMYIHKVVSSQ